jgi:transcriptional regulator with XRE-family HTH domain
LSFRWGVRRELRGIAMNQKVSASPDWCQVALILFVSMPYKGGVDPVRTRLRSARRYAGLSQRELALQLGVEEQWVKRREKGSTGVKDFEKRAWLTACDLPMEWLDVDVVDAVIAYAREQLAPDPGAALEQELQDAARQAGERVDDTAEDEDAQGGQGL